jgi:hypothetical protein
MAAVLRPFINRAEVLPAEITGEIGHGLEDFEELAIFGLVGVGCFEDFVEREGVQQLGILDHDVPTDVERGDVVDVDADFEMAVAQVRAEGSFDAGFEGDDADTG